MQRAYPPRLFSSVGQSTWFVISGSLVRIRQEAQNSERCFLNVGPAFFGRAVKNNLAKDKTACKDNKRNLVCRLLFVFGLSLKVACCVRRYWDVWLFPVLQIIGGRGRKRISPLIFQMFCHAALKGCEKNPEKYLRDNFFTSGRCLFQCRQEGDKNLKIVIFRVSCYVA